MLDSLLTLALLILFGFLILKRRRSSKGTFPPGPPALPILGNLLDIVRGHHPKFSEWADQHGNIFRVKLGTRNAIVLSDPKVLRDVLGKFATTGRFKTDTYLMVSKGPYGLINSEGKRYQELRSFTVQKLKTFGFGNKSIEPIITNEVQSLIRWIKENNMKNTSGDGIYFGDIMLLVTLNVLWTMVTGEQISYDDSIISSLIHEYIEATNRCMRSGVGIYSWLRYLAPEASGFNHLKRTAVKVRSYIEEQFTHHRETLRPGHPRDLIDFYLEHLSEVQDPNSGFFGEVGEINAVSSIMEMFLAGGDTTAQTITWAANYLCTKPEVQEKMKDEIFAILGPDGECSLHHREQMPYTEAVILETLRKSSLFPLGIFQETLDELHYDAYVFPKRTIVIPNLYHIHHNKEIWGDPQQFRPERFLEPGNEKLRENLVAFQPGKRNCVGEALARDQLFLILVNLIQHFEVIKSGAVDIEKYFMPTPGIMLNAPKCKLYFKSRK